MLLSSYNVYQKKYSLTNGFHFIFMRDYGISQEREPYRLVFRLMFRPYIGVPLGRVLA